jgi:hypothetical protein
MLGADRASAYPYSNPCGAAFVPTGRRLSAPEPTMTTFVQFLAQAADGVAETTTAAAVSGAAASTPSLPEHFAMLAARLSLPLAIAVALVALVSLTLGWRVYRILVVILCFAAFGLFAESATGHLQAADASLPSVPPWVVGVGVGGIVGFLAIPYLRFGLFTFCGLLGAYPTYLAGLNIGPEGFQTVWALGGFVITGLVALAFYELVIVIATAIAGGAGIILVGLYSLRLQIPTGTDAVGAEPNVATQVYDWAMAQPLVIPIAVLILAAMGAAIQLKAMPEEGFVRKASAGGGDADKSED